MEITLTLPDGVGLEMVRITAGSFRIGSPKKERGRYKNEGPVHTVTFERDFWMGKYEVTQHQWLAVAGRNPAFFKPPLYAEDLDRPVEQVSWKMIAGRDGFLARLNRHLADTGQGEDPVRLPSEAEWEYACRAETATRFYFGDSLAARDGRVDGPAGTWPGRRSDYMWFGGDAGFMTHRAGSRPANAWGLFDMHGNVWEWCQDRWRGDYKGAPTDGRAWESGGSLPRGRRGGGWLDAAGDCRSARRDDFNPSTADFTTGFRLARSL